VLKNTGGAYSCSCPAWRNQTTPIEARTCKHLRKLRGDAAEEARCGGALPQKPAEAGKEGPPLLLAHSWDGELDVTGWWMSEKLDGVRAYWDGTQFISRLGNLYHAPDWFKAGLPKDRILDGELWIDRGRFQNTIAVVRAMDAGERWKAVKYLTFDLPDSPKGFEERLLEMEELAMASSSKVWKLVDNARCRSVDHLKEELAKIEELGGEGLMLRQPGSLYEIGRSHTLLKVKSFKDDEARVLGTEPGKGKFKGMVGALLCELKNGKKFSVGTGMSNDERRDPPPVGAIITFRYQELTDDGIPRFPSYVGVREDVVWLKNKKGK